MILYHFTTLEFMRKERDLAGGGVRYRLPEEGLQPPVVENMWDDLVWLTSDPEPQGEPGISIRLKLRMRASDKALKRVGQQWISVVGNNGRFSGTVLDLIKDAMERDLTERKAQMHPTISNKEFVTRARRGWCHSGSIPVERIIGVELLHQQPWWLGICRTTCSLVGRRGAVP
jgi:hypothetical protein